VETKTQGPPPLVALVDDDASVRRALRRLISAAGFAVEAFASGQELLDSNAVHRAGCVILDVHLGDEGGFDVQQRLAALGLAVPIVFITGDNAAAIAEQALQAGAVACMRKPVSDAQLLRAIGEALGQHQPPE
jgi:FixJ family two-component response regulator